MSTGDLRRFLAVAVCLALAACSAGAGGRGSPDRDDRPNIVFVLADDLAWNLVDHMPRLRSMQRQGTTFTHYFVTDSLCCPSRATTFTGRAIT